MGDLINEVILIVTELQPQIILTMKIVSLDSYFVVDSIELHIRIPSDFIQLEISDDVKTKAF